MLLLVAGTRPNFMKIAPVLHALRRRSVPARWLHTGQHAGAAMSEVFFADLDLAPPDVALPSTSGTAAEQTAAVLVGVERELSRSRPDAVVVVGDVTSTLSAALAAAKLGVPVAHIESGLRARDWTMPEEINRVLTDQLADLCLTSTRDAAPNLRAEGVPEERIRFSGNVMVDSLHAARSRPTVIVDALGLMPGGFALLTLHRPANVDSRAAFEHTLAAIEALSTRLFTVFPVHPRTLSRARELGLAERLRSIPQLLLVDPLGHRDFVTLLASALLVATDSGGVQEETTALGVPCLTLRGGTERPITVDEGTNTIVGLDPSRIGLEVDAILAGEGKRGRLPEGWDGHAADRIAEALVDLLEGRPAPRTAGPRA